MTNKVFIGLDLSVKNPSSRAVLDYNLICAFDEWKYCTSGDSIVPPNIITSDYILAIDGPQGLAGNPSQKMRECERSLGTPGKSPYNFPQENLPFAGFVSGSVRLFYSLHRQGKFRLYGIDEISILETNLIEVYPGAAWRILSSGPIPKKHSIAGRQRRFQILQNCGVQFDTGFNDTVLPSHDQLDAALAAYIAHLFGQNKTERKGREPSVDMQACVIREGFIINLH